MARAAESICSATPVRVWDIASWSSTASLVRSSTFASVRTCATRSSYRRRPRLSAMAFRAIARPETTASAPRSDSTSAASLPVVHHGGLFTTAMSSADIGIIEKPTNLGRDEIEGSDSNLAWHTPTTRSLQPLRIRASADHDMDETSTTAWKPSSSMRTTLSAKMFSSEFSTVPVTDTIVLWPVDAVASEFFAFLNSSERLVRSGSNVGPRQP